MAASTLASSPDSQKNVPSKGPSASVNKLQKEMQELQKLVRSQINLAVPKGFNSPEEELIDLIRVRLSEQGENEAEKAEFERLISALETAKKEKEEAQAALDHEKNKVGGGVFTEVNQGLNSLQQAKAEIGDFAAWLEKTKKWEALQGAKADLEAGTELDKQLEEKKTRLSTLIVKAASASDAEKQEIADLPDQIAALEADPSIQKAESAKVTIPAFEKELGPSIQAQLSDLTSEVKLLYARAREVSQTYLGLNKSAESAELFTKVEADATTGVLKEQNVPSLPAIDAFMNGGILTSKELEEASNIQNHPLVDQVAEIIQKLDELLQEGGDAAALKQLQESLAKQQHEFVTAMDALKAKAQEKNLTAGQSGPAVNQAGGVSMRGLLDQGERTLQSMKGELQSVRENRVERANDAQGQSLDALTASTWRGVMRTLALRFNEKVLKEKMHAANRAKAGQEWMKFRDDTAVISESLGYTNGESPPADMMTKLEGMTTQAYGVMSRDTSYGGPTASAGIIAAQLLLEKNRELKTARADWAEKAKNVSGFIDALSETDDTFSADTDLLKRAITTFRGPFDFISSRIASNEAELARLETEKKNLTEERDRLDQKYADASLLLNAAIDEENDERTKDIERRLAEIESRRNQVIELIGESDQGYNKKMSDMRSANKTLSVLQGNLQEATALISKGLFWVLTNKAELNTSASALQSRQAALSAAEGKSLQEISEVTKAPSPGVTYKVVVSGADGKAAPVTSESAITDLKTLEEILQFSSGATIVAEKKV